MVTKQITRMVHEIASRHEVKEYDLKLSDTHMEVSVIKVSVNDASLTLKTDQSEDDVRHELNELFRDARCEVNT